MSLVSPERHQVPAEVLAAACTSGLKRRRSSSISCGSARLGRRVHQPPPARSHGRRAQALGQGRVGSARQAPRPGRVFARPAHLRGDAVQQARAHRLHRARVDQREGLVLVDAPGNAAPCAAWPGCRRGTPRRSAPAPARPGSARGSGAAARRSGRARSTSATPGCAAARDVPPSRRSGSSASALAKSRSLSTSLETICRWKERRKLAGSRRMAMIFAPGTTSAIAAGAARERRYSGEASPATCPGAAAANRAAYCSSVRG